MKWLKQITIDLLASIVIVIVVFFDTAILEYVVFIYTGLMVLARAITLANGNFRKITKKKVSEAPVWIFHLLYFINTAFLIYGEFYLTAAGWVFIWLVATYVHQLSQE
ncbi:MAG: hypothetical protein WEA56_10555 [Balneolaceae bacterium]